MTKPKPNFIFSEPRKTIEIYLPDGRVISGDRGAPIADFMNVLPEDERQIIVGAVVNSELRELTFNLDLDARVTPVTMKSADGARIYRRSLTFLLEVAFEDLFPKAELRIDHSVSSGGFYCQVTGIPPLNQEDLEALSNLMRMLVQTDLPFERQQVPLNDAIEYFKSKGEKDKVRLLTYRQKEFLILYRLENHRDYHHGYMVPSTGYLKWFGLTKMGDGFVISYPRRFAPTEIQPMPQSPKLLTTFQQYGDWLERLGIESVGALNDAIAAGRIREVILVSEALHEQRISEIASQIAQQSGKIRVVLISGPSSSGKTTFSKRLSVQLISQCESPFALEMDNYFVNREMTPKDDCGNYDYEALDALNRPLLNSQLQDLIAGNKVQIPHYDFKAGRSVPGETIHLHPGQLIILEGIHGLNPQLLTGIPKEQSYRIYVSSLTQLNLDKHNRISTTDTRLIRRIVRDASERGYSALQTLQRWESVRAGEKNHIFPYQENANTMFNSALAYELSALKPVVEPLLRQVPFGCQEYIEAKRLLAFLDWFLPVNSDLIPDNSIIREFLGGSILHDFKLWQNGQD
jgi:uridine kinase